MLMTSNLCGKPSMTEDDSGRKPLLSIVITSYTMERVKDCYELLDSIRNQTYPNIEVIFIVERSKELYEKVKEYGERIGLPNFRVLFSQDKLWLAGARDMGSREAAGEIIGFVDDDVVLSPQWSEAMVDSYRNQEVVGVTGATFPLWQDKKLDWLPKSLYWLVSCSDWAGWREADEVRSLGGMNMSVKKEVFTKVSFISSIGHRDVFMGHREPPIAEDLEFSLRVRKATGKKLIFSSRSEAGHKVYAYRLNMKFVASRARYTGFSRRLLRVTSLREQAPFRLERKVLTGIVKIYLSLPLDVFRRPVVACRKFVMTSTIVLFAGLGYIFPGRALDATRDIEIALQEEGGR